jgi:hypothetical protein
VQAVNFTLESVWVNGDEMILMSADLVVVRRAEIKEEDWECVAITVPGAAFELAPCQIRMTDLLTQQEFSGSALVVRSDEQRHVFRGAGPLAGIETINFSD